MESQSLGPPATIVTRIYVTREGDLLVTDLWDEVRELLSVAPERKNETDSDL